MAVDTSWEAVERLAQDVMAPDYLAPTKATVANTLRALLARAEAAEDEAYDLRLTILRGEDAPGFAGAVPLEKVKDLHDKHLLTMQWRAEDAERQRDAATAERDRLAGAFSAIEAECWDVRCIDVPTGCGDADVQWVVIAHYMAAPKEREVGHGTSPLSAIQAALASIKNEPTDDN